MFRSTPHCHSPLPYKQSDFPHLPQKKHGIQCSRSLEFVCYYSPALRAAFNSSFVEGQTQTYRLEDISTNAFRLFVQWLYSQKIDLHVGIDSVSDNSVQSVAGAGKNGSNKPGNEIEEDEEEEVSTELVEAWRAQDLDLAQLWVADDRLFIPSLQNTVTLAWYKLWYSNGKRGCSTSWFNYAYEHTCVGSHLRNLAVDQLAYSVGPDEIKKRAEELPREMLIDLTLVYSEAVWPIGKEHDDLQKKFAREYSEERPGSMAPKGYRYRCTRTWRNYLVPEDED